MPKQSTRAEVNTFVKGFITEASPLNFPDNASKDEVNFVLNRDGTRQRRLGFTFESGAISNSRNPSGFHLGLVNTTYQTGQFIWRAPGGDTTKDYLCIQSGNSIHIHNMASSPLSTPELVSLHTNIDPTIKMGFASVNGFLVVVGGYTSVYVIQQNEFGGFTKQLLSLKVRDVWGVQETDPALEANPALRPFVLSDTHRYNLMNQSWGYPRRNSTGVMVDAITQYATDLTVYPSSVEVVWSGLQFQPQTPPAVPFERMFTNMYEERVGQAAPATKGFFIIDLLGRGSSRASAVASLAANWPPTVAPGPLPNDNTGGGASCVCSFAGRVFYGGFNGRPFSGDSRTPEINNYVFFTQLVDQVTDIEKCYSVGDPTSREDSDLVDTDGGFIRISGAKKIVGFAIVGPKLAVFADNGVWLISGGGDFGFTATNYKVDKVSEFGCSSPESIVSSGNIVMFWGDAAIYAISPNQYGDYIVDDVTAATIQTWYNGIPLASRKTSFGVYDAVEKKIVWTYKIGTLFGASFTQQIIFDITLKAFSRYFIHNISPNTSEMVGSFYNYLREEVVYLIRTLVGGNASTTFGEFRETLFRDWGTVDAEAYVLTGAMTAGDSAIKKQAPYLTIHLRRTETTTDADGIPLNQSSCLFSARWGWANTYASHKITPAKEAYRYRQPLFANPLSLYDNGFETIYSKNKIRGSGNAISLAFGTSPGKECHLLGWNLTFNGNGIT